MTVYHPCAYLAKRKISLDLILSAAQSEGVKIGILGRPKVYFLRCDPDLIVREIIYRAVRESQRFGSVDADYLDLRIFHTLSDPERMNIFLGHRFEPYRLPYAAGRSIPHTASLFLLLSVRKNLGERVGNVYTNFVFTVPDKVGDVRREGEITALVVRAEIIIYVYVGYAVRSIDMQYNSVIYKITVKRKYTAVMHDLVARYFFVISRKSAFGRKGDEYFIAVIKVLAVIGHCKFPLAVKRNIRISHHARTGVVREWQFSCHFCLIGRSQSIYLIIFHLIILFIKVD